MWLLWLAGTTLVSPLAAAVEAPEPATNEFHFVVLGDSQLHRPADFNRLIDRVRVLRPAFVIQVGDMIEGYNSDLDAVRDEWRRFARQIAPLGPIRFMPVPGNHDVYGDERRVDPAVVDVYREVWGETQYTFRYRNTLGVVLNTDPVDAAPGLGDTQLAWLEGTLADAAAEHVFVFMHRPPDRLPEADALHTLLRRHPVRAVFYGHFHHYHFRERDGIRYVMTNAAANSAIDEDAVGTFDHLVQVAVRDAEVSLAVVRADGVLAEDFNHPTDNIELFQLSRGLAPATVPMQALAERRYAWHIPLENPTSRSVRIFVECGSADDRWALTPARIEPIPLAPGATMRLELEAAYAPEREPESVPECTLRVPYQKLSGEWLEHRRSVRAVTR